jgi:hypothetical protein
MAYAVPPRWNMARPARNNSDVFARCAYYRTQPPRFNLHLVQKRWNKAEPEQAYPEQFPGGRRQ